MGCRILRKPVLLLVLALSVGLGVGGVAAEEPSLTVTIDGTQVSGGETVRTDQNPTVEISVAANSTVERVVVRVDGEARETYQPGNKTVSNALRLDLDDGEHDVAVAVTAGNTTTLETTVLKDAAPPLIRYTSPFQTPEFRSPEEPIVSAGNVTLAGEFLDLTGVETVRIERTYDFSFAGSDSTSRAFYDVQSPGQNFSADVLLGDGENELTARYTDRLGNTRVQRFSVRVDDDAEPEIDITAPSETGASAVPIRGTVSDNVKLDTVRVLKSVGGERQVVSSTSPEPSRERLSVRVDQRRSLSAGVVAAGRESGENVFVVKATDVAGNTAREQFRVFYDPSMAPQVNLDREETRIDGDSLLVRGRVEKSDIARVSVQSVEVGSGEAVDSVEAYAGDDTIEVSLDHSVSLSDGPTRVEVNTTTADGDRHETSLLANPETGFIRYDVGPNATDPSGEGSDTPTVAATPSGDNGDTETQNTGENRKTDPEPPTDSETRDQSDAETTTGTGGESTPSATGPGFTAAVTLLALLLVGVRLAVWR